MIPITGHTRLTALLGSPVAHSISPLMHNEAFSLLGLDYVYLCFDVTEDTLPDAVTGLKAAGIRGFNLTMPNKNRILDFLDDLSPAARLIGAVNTVVVEDNGSMTGHNTDGIGYMRAVQDAGYDIRGKTVTLLGAGGAATAICAQAALDGVNAIHLFLRSSSRFYPRMKQLSDTINETTSCHIFLHENGEETALRKSLSESSMLINATSVGMAPNTEECLIPDLTYFHKELVVSDVIYNPRKTKLMRLAEEAGCAAFNGMYMLLYQGAEAFRLWTGHEMPIDPIREKFFS